MNNDFRAIIQIAYDMAKGNKQLQDDIKKIQEQYKIIFKAELDEKSALNSIKQMEKYQDSFNKKNLNGIDLEIKKRQEQSQIFSNQIKSQMQERVSAENKIQAELKQTAKEQQNAFKLDEGKLQVFNRIGTYMSNNTKLTKEQVSSLKELQTSISNVNDKSGLDQIKTKFSSIKSEANALGSTGDTIFTRLKKNSAQFLNYLGSATIIMGSIRAFQNIVDEVKNIDSAMISLKKVTNETDVTYESFLVSTAQKAKELGASISDLVNATADFARLGYNLPDASKLGEVATLYKNVGDGINIEGATQSIISTMKAFNIQAENSMSIIDKFNQVGNNFAISSAGIGDSLMRSASALMEANNTLDESIALTVAANNVVQDPEKVGNMWKTVAMRIRGAKTELEEAGLETEGMVESTSKLRDEIKSLTGGFDIMIDNNTFKSTYDIVLGISKVYDKMSDTSQANILEMLAGKRQGNALAAALNNAEDLQKALESSQQSFGSALDEQRKYEEGIQYSLDRLKASTQELSMTTLDSSIIKFIVDLANGTVNATTAVGGLVPVLKTLLVLYLSFNKNEKYAFMQNFISLLFRTKLNAEATAISIGGLTLSVKALTGIITGGLLIAIPLIVKGLDAITTSAEEQAEKINSSIATYKEISTNLVNYNSELETTRKRIDELNKLKSPSLMENFELEELKKYNSELERSIELEKIRKDSALQSTMTNITNGLEDSQKGFDARTYKDNVKEIQSYIESAYSSMEGASSWASGETLTKYIEEKQRQVSAWNTDIANLKSKYLEHSNKIEEWIKVFEDYGVDKLTPFNKNVYDNLKKELDDLYKTALSKDEYFNIQIKPKFELVYNSEDFKTAKSELEALAKAGELTPDTIHKNDEYLKLIHATGMTVKEVVAYIDDLTNSTDDASDSISRISSDSFDTLNKSLDELDKKSKDTVSSIKELNQVIYDQSQGTKLTSEQAYKLIAQYPQLASALEKTTDGYLINEEAINDVRLALIEQEKANATAQLNMTTDTLNAVSDRVEAYGIELEAITSIASAIAEQKKLSLNETFGTMEGWSFDDASKRIATPTGSFIANATATEYDSIKKAYEEQKLINDTIGKMGNLQERINGLQNSIISDSGFGVSTKNTKDTKTKSTDHIKEAFDKKKNDIDHLLAMDEITQDEYYKRLEKLNNKYFGKNKKTHLENYRQYVAEIYKGRKKIDDDKIKSEFDDLSHSFAMGDIKSEEKYQKKRYNLAKKYYKNNEDYLDEWKKAQEEWYKWNLEKAEESAKNQEKIAENLKDKYIDLINDIADEIKKEKDDVLDSLEATHKATIKNLEDEKDSYKEIIDTQLDLLDAKKKQNDYEKSIANKTKEISKIESRKAELEKAANSGDRSAIAELAKLNEDLSKKKEDLLDEQSDHEYDLQKESLSNALDLNDKLMDAKINAENSRFETQKSNIEKLYDKEIELINKAAQYTKEEFSKALDGIATELASNGVTQSGGSLSSIKKSQTSIAGSEINASTSNRSAILAILSNGQGKDYKEEASALASYTRDNYGNPISKKQAVDVAKLLGVSGINSVNDLTGNDENKNKILEALRKAGFSKGGYVDASMIKRTGEDGLALVRHGEPILTVEQGKLFKELVNNIKPLNNLVKLSTPNLSSITNNNSSPNITVNLPPSTTIDNNAINNYRKLIPELTNAISEELLGISRQYK